MALCSLIIVHTYYVWTILVYYVLQKNGYKCHTWLAELAEVYVDEDEVEDDGTARVVLVLEHVAFLQTFPIHHGLVDGREWHVVQFRPLSREEQLLKYIEM